MRRQWKAFRPSTVPSRSAYSVGHGPACISSTKISQTSSRDVGTTWPWQRSVNTSSSTGSNRHPSLSSVKPSAPRYRLMAWSAPSNMSVPGMQGSFLKWPAKNQWSGRMASRARA